MVASELVILITFFCIFMINFTDSDKWHHFITEFVIYSVIGFIIFEGFIEILKFYRVIKDLIDRHIRNKRAKAELIINSVNSL